MDALIAHTATVYGVFALKLEKLFVKTFPTLLPPVHVKDGLFPGCILITKPDVFPPPEIQFAVKLDDVTLENVGFPGTGGVGIGVAVGTGVAVGVEVGTGVAVGVEVGTGVAVGEGVAVGVGVG